MNSGIGRSGAISSATAAESERGIEPKGTSVGRLLCEVTAVDDLQP
jgi:hypothetical protein